MAAVLLTGATGTLGRALLASGHHREHRVRAAARRVPTGTAHDDVQWTRLDLLGADGLDAALDGVEVVLHAASAPRGDARRTEVDGTRRLLDAAARAGVQHFVYVSIVGVDRIPVAYYRHKLEAERLVSASDVPWSIVRGTQFHELIDTWCAGLARSPLPVAMRGWKVQPIAAVEFANALWQRIALGPAHHAPDVAGPQVLEWPAVVSAWRAATGRRPFTVGLPLPGRLSRLMREGAACSPAHATGVLTWRDWLARHYGPGA